MTDHDFRTNDLVSGKTLARLGLGLVLLAIVFLYRWGMQEGYIGPEARVASGVLLSTGLLGVGWATRIRQPLYSALLQGGGVAGLFVSAFAAHAVYELTGETAVFIQLVFVSALAIGLAVAQRIETLAIVGVLGALAAPQMVGGTIDAFPGDAGYVGVVLLTVGALLYFFDWRWLFGVASIASGATLAAEMIELYGGWSFTGPEALVAYTAAFVGLWGGPMGRLAARRRQHATTAMVAAVVIPIAAFFGAYAAWPNPNDLAWGAAAVGMAVAMAAVYGAFRNDEPFVATLHLIPASVMAVTAVTLMLEGPSLMFALAAEGVGFVLIGRRVELGALTITGGTMYAVTAAYSFALMVTERTEGIPGLNSDGIARLGVILLGAFLGVVLMRSDDFDDVSIGRILAGYAHVGFMVWAFAELSRTEIGQPVVSAVWGVYALIVVAVAWGRSRFVRNIGLGTLLLTVAKIFIIDLENASGGAKILLLLGFGLALLALGYLMPSDSANDRHEQTPEPKPAEPVGPRS